MYLQRIHSLYRPLAHRLCYVTLRRVDATKRIQDNPLYDESDGPSYRRVQPGAISTSKAVEPQPKAKLRGPTFDSAKQTQDKPLYGENAGPSYRSVQRGATPNSNAVEPQPKAKLRGPTFKERQQIRQADLRNPFTPKRHEKLSGKTDGMLWAARDGDNPSLAEMDALADRTCVHIARVQASIAGRPSGAFVYDIRCPNAVSPRAVVREWARRRVKRAVHDALRAKGLDHWGLSLETTDSAVKSQKTYKARRLLITIQRGILDQTFAALNGDCLQIVRKVLP